MEWNKFNESCLDVLKQRNEMEVTLFGSNIKKNENESFYNNITIIPFIFIKCRINLQNNTIELPHHI